jgi:hypothetical protein
VDSPYKKCDFQFREEVPKMQPLTPSTDCLNAPMTLLRIRDWATDLRDGSKLESDSPCCTLVRLIDVRPMLMANNARESIDRSILMLIGLLVVSGGGSPSIPKLPGRESLAHRCCEFGQVAT